MDKSDRFLIGIVIGVVVLIIAAVMITLIVGRQSQAPVPDDTPEGVVQNYVLAIQNEDYTTAYSYLSPSLKQYPTLDEFREELENATSWRRQSRSKIGIRVQDVNIDGDTARVYVSVSSFRVDESVFSANEWTREESVRLQRENGEWKITRFFHPYWRWKWANPPTAPNRF